MAACSSEKVAGDDESLGYEIANPALVLLLALFVGLDDTISLRLPAVGGDQVAIVLHGLGPVVHHVLIDIVGVDEWLVGVVRQQALGKLSDDLPGLAAGPQFLERYAALVSRQTAKWAVMSAMKEANSGCS